MSYTVPDPAGLTSSVVTTMVWSGFTVLLCVTAPGVVQELMRMKFDLFVSS